MVISKLTSNEERRIHRKPRLRLGPRKVIKNHRRLHILVLRGVVSHFDFSELIYPVLVVQEIISIYLNAQYWSVRFYTVQRQL
jgi:hypothetical protein